MSDTELGAGTAKVLLKHLDPVTRESGLRLDRHGRWHHQEIPVTHERLHLALTRWLDRADEGERFILRLAADFWAYVDVEDAPFQATVTGLTGDDTALALQLSDESEETYAGPTIFVGVDDAWYVPVKEGRFEARLGRGAQTQLAEYMEEDAAEPEGVVLQLPGGARLGFVPRAGS